MNPSEIQAIADEVVARYRAGAAARPKGEDGYHAMEFATYSDEESMRVLGEDGMTLDEHHELIDACAVALLQTGVDSVELRRFDMAEYRSWLGQREDTRDRRMEFMAQQKRLVWSFVIGKGGSKPGHRTAISEAIRQLP